MAIDPFTFRMLEEEARGLQTRLDRVKPFALLEPMVPAANLFPNAQSAIERALIDGRRELRRLMASFLAWLQRARAAATPADAQRRLSILRLRFHQVLNEFDMYSDVITQRSEHDNGPWLSGLDSVAADALTLQGQFYELPPVVCHLERGPGAAIRRARTRLPGGRTSPVAVIRVPRERMVGSGIASSLIHETGHQAAALIELVPSLRAMLKPLKEQASPDKDLWGIWDRWISEIVADFFSVARVGITSTIGLIGVVSLPRAFVFRVDVNDPHPTPWLRVKISAAIGQALYPHPQWARISALWEQLYPREGLDLERRTLFERLENHMPQFVARLVEHRPEKLRGQTLPEVLQVQTRAPMQLSMMFQSWSRSPAGMYRARPTVVFAVLGQARADGKLSPEDESVLIGKLLTFWALKSTLDTSYACALTGETLRGGPFTAAIRSPNPSLTIQGG
ncbi:hypothetical protein [Ensifer adhaerens]|uniref:hypothetical protein n=1 Tax=Ensifer adhaerens TaxID=106592 RepID=UPI0008074D25|nr:hypothetical protein [Ensifer adhaerens]